MAPVAQVAQGNPPSQVSLRSPSALASQLPLWARPPHPPPLGPSCLASRLPLVVQPRVALAAQVAQGDLGGLQHQPVPLS